MTHAFQWAKPTILADDEDAMSFDEAMNDKGYCLVPFDKQAIANWHNKQEIDYDLANHLLANLLHNREQDIEFQNLFEPTQKDHNFTAKRAQHFFTNSKTTAKEKEPSAATEGATRLTPKQVWPRLRYQNIFPHWHHHLERGSTTLENYIEQKLQNINFSRFVSPTSSEEDEIEVEILQSIHTIPTKDTPTEDLSPLRMSTQQPEINERGMYGLVAATTIPFVCVEGSHSTTFRKTLTTSLNNATQKHVRTADQWVHLPLAIGDDLDPVGMLKHQVIIMVPPGYMLIYQRALAAYSAHVGLQISVVVAKTPFSCA